MKQILKKIFNLRSNQNLQKKILLEPQHTLSIQIVEKLLGFSLFPTANLAMLTVIHQKQLDLKRSQAAFKQRPY